MPENVRDRDELLLNAIVTGDTSGIEPRDREETFIKAIAEKIAHLPVLTKVGSVRVKPPQTTIEASSGRTLDGTFTITPESGYSFPNNRIPITDILIFSGCSNMNSSIFQFGRLGFNENAVYHTYQFAYSVQNISETPTVLETSSYNFYFDIYRLI